MNCSNEVRMTETNTEKMTEYQTKPTRQPWKGKVMMVGILILSLLLSYYHPLSSESGFISNFIQYLIYIGLLAPLILYIILNEWDKHKMRKAGIDVKAEREKKLEEKSREKARLNSNKPLNPLLVSLLGTYYNLTNPMNTSEEESEITGKENNRGIEDEMVGEMVGEISEETKPETN